MTEDYCIFSGKEICILRLPIGHSELNPIELIWAQSKNKVAKNNSKFNVTAVQGLMSNALLNITTDNWKKAVSHVKKVEDAFRKVDFGDSETPRVDELIIEVRSEDFYSDDSDSYSDSDGSD